MSSWAVSSCSLLAGYMRGAAHSGFQGKDLTDGTDSWFDNWMSLRGIGTRLDNRLSVICVNLRTIEKGSQIMRACGVLARVACRESVRSARSVANGNPAVNG
jgi:hypothetical protein